MSDPANIVLTFRDGPHRYFFACAPTRASELSFAIDHQVDGGWISVAAAQMLSQRLLFHVGAAEILRARAGRSDFLGIFRRALRYLRSCGGGR